MTSGDAGLCRRAGKGQVRRWAHVRTDKLMVNTRLGEVYLMHEHTWHQRWLAGHHGRLEVCTPMTSEDNLRGGTTADSRPSSTS